MVCAKVVGVDCGGRQGVAKVRGDEFEVSFLSGPVVRRGGAWRCAGALVTCQAPLKKAATPLLARAGPRGECGTG